MTLILNLVLAVRLAASVSAAVTTAAASLFPPVCSVPKAGYYTSGQNCDRLNYPWYINTYENPYYELARPTGANPLTASTSLQSSCGDIWSSSFTQWLESAPLTYGSIIPVSTEVDYDVAETITESNSAITSMITISGTTETIATYSAYTYASYISSFTFTATSPCCSSCTLYGGTVQVYYWPSKTQTGAKFANSTAVPTSSTLVNEGGFTFVSPSIYVAFQSLVASNLCGQVGEKYTSTTVAFDPTALSTGPAYSYNTSAYTYAPSPLAFTQATWGDQNSCGDVVSTFWQGANSAYDGWTTYPEGSTTISYTLTEDDGPVLTDYVESWQQYIITYNPCSPMISVPSALFTLNSAWGDCVPGLSSFYDPPYPLTAGSGLSMVTPSVDIPTVAAGPATSAAAGATPMTSLPISTTPIPVPVTSTSNVAVPIPTYSAVGDVSQASQIYSQEPPLSSSTDATVNDPIPITSSSTATETDPITMSSTPTKNDPSTPIITAVIIVTSVTPASNPAAPSPISNNPPISSTTNPISAYIISSQTLIPGAAITFSGSTLSLLSDGSSIIVGHTTIPISSWLASNSIITISSTFPTPAPAASAAYVIDSQTINPGAPGKTIYGTYISLQPSGSNVVVGSTTIPVSSWLALNNPSPSLITGYILNSQTLVAGKPAITISGQSVSLQSGGKSIIVGSSTVAFDSWLASNPASASTIIADSTSNIAGAIVSIGGFASSSSSSSQNVQYTGVPAANGTIFTGTAANKRPCKRSLVMTGIMLMGGVIVVL